MAAVRRRVATKTASMSGCVAIQGRDSRGTHACKITCDQANQARGIRGKLSTRGQGWIA